jgi:Secretion system C-terminal sorting domain
LYPQGNNLGRVTTSYYKHNGPVRQNGEGRYYLDRNLTISVTTQPTTPYNLRFPYQNSELNAIIAQPGSGITSQFDLVLTKNGNACLNALGVSAGAIFFPTGFGSISGDRFVDVTNITGGFSSFYLHGGSTVLPVSIEYLKGSKQGTANYLDWKITCTSAPSVTISLERSADGRTFKAIQDQNATAARCLQGFNYTDASPLAGANYYRLKITTPDGQFRYSTIVVLLNKEKGFELISLAPNPVKNSAMLTLTSAKAGRIEIAVSDIAGRVVAKQNVTIIAGNNPIDMNFANLGAGTYTIAAINTDGERKTTRFVKY